MEAEEYSRLYDLETTYWWHVGRIDLLRSVLDDWVPDKPRRILDFGCGTGVTLNVLRDYGEVVGADSSLLALERARERIGGRTDITLTHLSPDTGLPFEDASFDVATALDVLEHTDDDQEVLRDLHRVLRPGGILIVFVPAYRILWSEHDEALHHRRRYVASELHAKLNQSGFRVVKRSYTVTFCFPLIAGYRVLKGFFPTQGKSSTSYVILPRPINGLFTWLLKLEARLVRVMSLPFGSSILAVGRK